MSCLKNVITPMKHCIFLILVKATSVVKIECLKAHIKDTLFFGFEN
jgi:hypothetical protein